MGRNTRDASLSLTLSLEMFHRNSNDIQMFYNRSNGSRGDDATGDVILVRFGSMRRTHRLSRTNVYADNYPSTDDDSLDRVLTE